ncbi:MAG TPA: hypothetical protein VNY77_02935 [Candidatus Angelobacter sp.]|nr:hypothetical protein [Candidatus Angelobacter sp.]
MAVPVGASPELERSATCPAEEGVAMDGWMGKVTVSLLGIPLGIVVGAVLAVLFLIPRATTRSRRRR